MVNWTSDESPDFQAALSLDLSGRVTGMRMYLHLVHSVHSVYLVHSVNSSKNFPTLDLIPVHN